MVIDFDDQGSNHVISDMCQTHDCRDKLDELHYANEKFKVTLFAVPAEMTIEQLDWFNANQHWVELAVHGWKHTSNYECEKWTFEECQAVLNHPIVQQYFVKGFKAPGWQISDECYIALQENGFWVADQDYNTHRRHETLPAYINRDGTFFTHSGRGDNDWIETDAWHGHTWDCVGNGIYETFPQLLEKVKNADSFEFISEVLA